MKIYEKQLVSLATSKVPADRVGWLLKRGEVNKNFQKRWFVLRGNLLFYFERAEREPVGLIILEGCSIELAECSETERYAFLIIFHGQGVRTYTLAADSQDEMEGWMKALSCANYDFLRNTVAELQRQIDEIRSSSRLTGDSAETASLVPFSSATSPVSAADNNHHNYNSSNTAQQTAPQAPRRKARNYSQRQPPPTNLEFSELHARYGQRIDEVFGQRRDLL